MKQTEKKMHRPYKYARMGKLIWFASVYMICFVYFDNSNTTLLSSHFFSCSHCVGPFKIKRPNRKFYLYFICYCSLQLLLFLWLLLLLLDHDRDNRCSHALIIYAERKNFFPQFEYVPSDIVVFIVCCLQTFAVRTSCICVSTFIRKEIGKKTKANKHNNMWSRRSIDCDGNA